jgi:hypothetical protein
MVPAKDTGQGDNDWLTGRSHSMKKGISCTIPGILLLKIF